jgi:phosphoribosyl 1,2-cyclic phosphodiesterase
MDHIQGLGFFGPLYDPGVDVHIWGPASSMLRLEARLSRYLSPPLFPVHLRDLPKVVCHEVPRPPFDIGPFRIRTALVCHPGPTVGYRIETAGGSMVYLPDHEPALGLPNGLWPAPDWISGYDLAFNADLLIHDAQYTDEEYASCVGWGHSTYRHAFEFAAQVGAKRLVPFHHDPSHDDDMLDRLLEDSIRRFKSPCSAVAGREGAVFSI